MKTKNIYIFLTSLFVLSSILYANPGLSYEDQIVNLTEQTLSADSEILGPHAEEIVAMAKVSKCAKYSWLNRGQSPIGYIKGVAYSFARSLCRLKTESSPLTNILTEAQGLKSSSRDAISHYASIFDNLKIPIRTSGIEPLQAVYTLGLGLGMRESSGKYCEGWDVAAGANRPSSEAEAGLFQVSYNSIHASSELRKLYNEYQDRPEWCGLEIFKEKVNCKPQSILGDGEGATFQSFVKSCPVFATEYAMVLLRILRKHFGPINRKEAEVKLACHKLISDVTIYVENNAEQVCRELL